MPSTELRGFIRGVLSRGISAGVVGKAINVAVDVVVKGGVRIAIGQKRADFVFSRGQPLMNVEVRLELYNP